MNPIKHKKRLIILRFAKSTVFQRRRKRDLLKLILKKLNQLRPKTRRLKLLLLPDHLKKRIKQLTRLIIQQNQTKRKPLPFLIRLTQPKTRLKCLMKSGTQSPTKQ